MREKYTERTLILFCTRFVCILRMADKIVRKVWDDLGDFEKNCSTNFKVFSMISDFSTWKEPTCVHLNISFVGKNLEKKKNEIFNFLHFLRKFDFFVYACENGRVGPDKRFWNSGFLRKYLVLLCLDWNLSCFPGLSFQIGLLFLNFK